MEEITKRTLDKEGHVVCTSEILKDEHGRVISEKYYNKDGALFEECERCYNEIGKQIRLIKRFPLKQKTTVFEYDYDEKNRYSKISQTDTITMVEQNRVQEYKKGKFFKEIFDVYPTVHLTRVLHEDKQTQKIYCNGKVLIEDCKQIHFDNVLNDVSEHKVSTDNPGLSELLNNIIDSIIVKDWHLVTELADELHEYAEEEMY